MRMIRLAALAVFLALPGAAVAGDDMATCAVKCRAANPNGCEGNSRATQICFNKCVGYTHCSIADAPGPKRKGQ